MLLLAMNPFPLKTPGVEGLVRQNFGTEILPYLRNYRSGLTRFVHLYRPNFTVVDDAVVAF